ncbi:hypothetical protein GCM10011608_04850 [Micromonospora sonchi]|uniref:Uncharacterized protein n=1 Tax=Micromonospora sonchi TaxID=1763543 RepID=A0A917TJJ6_9ACTN|nr:hypothetical protein GCM10011608_04850 [Micromonospora sonchi]
MVVAAVAEGEVVAGVGEAAGGGGADAAAAAGDDGDGCHWSSPLARPVWATLPAGVVGLIFGLSPAAGIKADV